MNNKKYEWLNSLDELEYDDGFLFDFLLFGIYFIIQKKFEFGISLLTCEPYAFDGSVPYTYFNLGFVIIQIKSKLIYKFLYKRKYGHNPRGLK